MPGPDFQDDPVSRIYKKGFTLIEILIVVGIVALLAGILVPSLAWAIHAARKVECINNLHTLGIGIQSYQNDFNNLLPWEGYAEGDRPVRHLGPWADLSQWFNAAPLYAGQPTYYSMQQDDLEGRKPLPHEDKRGLFVCPESIPAVAGPKDDLVQDGCFMLWGTNADGTKLERRKTFWSYGYNTQLDGGVEDRHVGRRVYNSMLRIQRPAEVPILVEKLMRPDEFNPPFCSSVGQAEVSWREFSTRHNQGGLLLFLDNHVDYFKRDELVNVPKAPDDYNQPGKVVWNPSGAAN